MLGLLSVTTAGCNTATNKPDPKTLDPNHPCYGQGNCGSYVVLPDGGAASVDASRDAGVVTICGPCNG
jgi:hypothetical protein